jgi:hypothetical protein
MNVFVGRRRFEAAVQVDADAAFVYESFHPIGIVGRDTAA